MTQHNFRGRGGGLKVKNGEGTGSIIASISFAYREFKLKRCERHSFRKGENVPISWESMKGCVSDGPKVPTLSLKMARHWRSLLKAL